MKIPTPTKEKRKNVQKQETKKEDQPGKLASPTSEQTPNQEPQKQEKMKVDQVQMSSEATNPEEEPVTVTDEEGNPIITLRNNNEKLLFQITQKLNQIIEMQYADLKNKGIITEQQPKQETQETP